MTLRPHLLLVLDFHDILAADIGSHDDHGVFKIHRPALAVGHAAVIQDLQQGVKDLGMGLFNLVKQDHRIGAAADSFGQLAAFLVPHVARRRADEAGDRMLLHVFGHIQPNQGLFRIKEKFGQGPGQLRLAHPRWGP